MSKKREGEQGFGHGSLGGHRALIDRVDDGHAKRRVERGQAGDKPEDRDHHRNQNHCGRRAV
jgi:hypothetical protein